jgi:hypothetical protein
MTRMGGSTMTRHLFFAITLIGTGVLLNSPAAAKPSAAKTPEQCESQATSCLGVCAEMSEAKYNKCVPLCDRQRTRCLKGKP